VTFVVGTGTNPVLDHHVLDSTSITQDVSPAEDTIWMYFSRTVTATLLTEEGWTIHADDGPVKHVWAYAPESVSGPDLGSYTFHDYPATTTLPTGVPLLTNGLYFRGAPGHFTVHIRIDIT